LSETAFENNPNGNLGEYVMDLAEEDSEALGASLVLTTEQETRLDDRGRPLKGDDGEDLPPLWRPKRLHAVDVVDTGDATRSFLSADLPDDIVRQGAALLDRQFGGCEPDVIHARCAAWMARYMELRFPEWEPKKQSPSAGDPEIFKRRNRGRWPGNQKTS
jgi:hypothetical protein